MKKFKSLRYFLLQSKVRLLYRDYYKLISKLDDPSLIEEYKSELRGEFSKYENLEDEDKIDYLVADGRKRFPIIKEMFSMLK
jgi:hypothetical protein